MHKALPLWLFLLCLLLGALFTMVFGWFVQKAGHDQTEYKRLGQAAIAIASFPDLVRESFRTVSAAPDEKVRVPRERIDPAGFEPIKTLPGMNIQGLLVRADDDALARASGWRILVGSFSINGALENAALLLSPQLQVVKVWPLEEKNIPGVKPHPAHLKFAHGFAILPDASLVFGFDNGVSLQRIDACGARLWAKAGTFDHAVSLDNDARFLWTLDDSEQIVKMASADGAILQRISMADIAQANPGIHILDIRQDDLDRGNDNSRHAPIEWTDDPFHLNDVEPLPAGMAAGFAGFAAGDLLVSSRSLNLIFVLDPATLKVRWWHSGSWRRQHDPDWQPTGEITVFDNHMNGDFSRIVSIRPGASQAQVIFDGRRNDFYSRIRGKHQRTGADTWLITSSQQGRVFEVQSDGGVVFEMVNLRPDRNDPSNEAPPDAARAFNYPLSEAIWLPSDTPVFKEGIPCTSQVTSSRSPPSHSSR